MKNQRNAYSDFELSIFFQVSLITKCIFHLASKNAESLNINLNPNQLHVLFTIYHNQGLSQQELAEIVERNKSSIQRTIQSFLKKDLIKLYKDKNDKRKNLIAITPTGEKISLAIKKVIHRTENDIKEILTTEQYEEYLTLTKALAEKLNNKILN